MHTHIHTHKHARRHTGTHTHTCTHTRTHMQASLAMPPPKDPMELAPAMYAKPDEIDTWQVTLLIACF